MAVLGYGDYRYERVPSWPNMPRYRDFGLASDGTVNSRDEVHIFGRGDHPLTIWDTDGNVLSRRHVNEPNGEGTILGGHGITVDSHGSIYVTEIGSGNRVSKFVRV